MSTFSSAMSTHTTRLTTTENGAVSISTDGVRGKLDKIDGDFVGFWNKMVQGFSQERIVDYVRVFINSAKEYASAGDDEKSRQIIERMFVIWAETRDCRGNLAGKGWRDGSMWLFYELYKHFPQTVEALLPSYTEYGSWRDLNSLYKYLYPLKTDGDESVAALMNSIVTLYASALLRNYNALPLLTAAAQTDDGSGAGSGEDEFVLVRPPKIDLSGKWAPHQNSSIARHTKMHVAIARRMWPLHNGNKGSLLKKYRKLRVALNSHLKTTEVFMCDKRFQDIEYQRVPGRCMNKNTKAFLYEKRKSSSGELRGSDPDRILARSNFQQYLVDVSTGKKSINGSQLYIHEIVAKLVQYGCSEGEKTTLELQWNDHFDKLCAYLIEEFGEDSLPLVLVLADVSGSMSGDPMNAAIAMAMMFGQIMEKFNPEFGNRFISFHERPRWISLNYPESLESWTNMKTKPDRAFDPTRAGGKMSLYERAMVAHGSEWGYNTDFVAAYEMILTAAIEANLQPEQLPHMFVVCSDMQFDDANRSRNAYNTLCSLGPDCAAYFGSVPPPGQTQKTTHERLEKAFHDAGIKACGSPYKMPTHVYWNLRGDTVDFPVSADKSNVMMISGFNVGTLKLFMCGKTLERVDEEMNSFSIFNDMLEDPRYALVFDIVRGIGEIPL